MLSAFIQSMSAYFRARRTANVLDSLSDHQLKDIGIRRPEAIEVRLHLSEHR